MQQGTNMTRFIFVIMSSLMLFSSPLAFAQQGAVTGGIHFDIPDWFKTSFLEIAEDVEEANDEGKHVMLFMHLNGCPYCDKMVNENFADDALKPYLIKHFDSIALNIQGDREIEFNEEVSTTERALAQLLNVQYTPTILFLNSDNKTVLRLNGYRSPETVKHALEFVQTKAYLKTSFNQFKNKRSQRANYQLSASSLYSSTTDFSNITTPVAIMFEDVNCDECATFQKDILARPEIQEQFKRYTFVRLDALSDDVLIDFNGHKTTAKQWAESLKMSYRPGIVLFDEQQETGRIESMLYPFHFESVLRYGLDKSYKSYASYLDLMGVRIEQLTQQGINVNIGVMAF